MCHRAKRERSRSNLTPGKLPAILLAGVRIRRTEDVIECFEDAARFFAFKRIVYGLPVAARSNQTVFPKEPEMLGNDRLGDPETLRQLSYRALLIDQLAQDHQPVLARYGLEQSERFACLFADIVRIHTCVYAKMRI